MRSQRKRYSADFKAKVALEAIKGHRTINEIAAKFQAHPNQVTQRLWRSVKYEEVYLKDYQVVADAELGLAKYFEFYNRERLHQSL